MIPSIKSNSFNNSNINSINTIDKDASWFPSIINDMEDSPYQILNVLDYLNPTDKWHAVLDLIHRDALYQKIENILIKKIGLNEISEMKEVKRTLQSLNKKVDLKISVLNNNLEISKTSITITKNTFSIPKGSIILLAFQLQKYFKEEYRNILTGEELIEIFFSDNDEVNFMLNEVYNLQYYPSRLQIALNLAETQLEVNMLLQVGADIHKIYKLYTPVFHAIKNGHIEALNALLNAGAYTAIETRHSFSDDGSSVSMLHVAAKYGHLEIIKFLVKRNKRLINKNVSRLCRSSRRNFWHDFDDEFGTPLHLATKYGHIDAIKYLIENGADVNAVISEGYSRHHGGPKRCENSCTPLHVAVAFHNVEAVKILVSVHPEMANLENFFIQKNSKFNFKVTKLLAA